ncbi:T9SS type A sorting domain-containing protein [candidate division KSB1 bacterium]|nr:T9SS type A sorting domain-containing protein [candidate division KSB1 bacterium]
MLNRLIHSLLLILIFGVLFSQFVFAEMTVTITSPKDGDAFSTVCSDIELSADVQITEGEVSDVRFYYNGKYIGRARSAPWNVTWKSVKSGNYYIQAKASDNEANDAWSDSIKIRVGDISRGEVIINGGFDCGMSPWTLNNYGDEGQPSAVSRAYWMNDFYFDDSTYIYIDITSGSTLNWHIQFSQAFPLLAGHIYELTFVADADKIKPIDILHQENGDDYTTNWIESMDIDGPGMYGPYTFNCTFDDPANIFKFNIGANEINCYFDNVQIIDRSLTSISSKNLFPNDGVITNYELFQSYPNPFNMNTRIPFQLSKSTHVVLSLYNLQGQLVKTLVNEIRDPGMHYIQWDGTDETHSIVPTGVYIYRLEIPRDKVQLSRKVLLLK